MTCALRFDGYRYSQATNLTTEGVIDTFVASGRWDQSHLGQLAHFFLLQRYLFKWGGESEPHHGKYWRAFRSLFLQAHSYEIPVEYRVQQYYDEWERVYRPHIEQCVALVRFIHDHTPYDDFAGGRSRPLAVAIPPELSTIRS